MKIEIDTDDPFYPFPTEEEWLNYNNYYLELHCDHIINYDGKGVCGSEKLQHIKEVYFNYKTNGQRGTL